MHHLLLPLDRPAQLRDLRRQVRVREGHRAARTRLLLDARAPFGRHASAETDVRHRAHRIAVSAQNGGGEWVQVFIRLRRVLQ